jgi:uncharacterized membrane protein HdeD (DUF308 family)
MSMSVESAARALREAMRETVKRHSLWYLVQGALMVLAGIVALTWCWDNCHLARLPPESMDTWACCTL